MAGSNLSKISGCSAACSCLSIHSQRHSNVGGKTLAVIAAEQPSNFLSYYSMCKEDVRHLRQVAGCGLRTRPPLASRPFILALLAGIDGRARALLYIAPRYVRPLHTVSDVRGRGREGGKLGRRGSCGRAAAWRWSLNSEGMRPWMRDFSTIWRTRRRVCTLRAK